MKLFTLITLMLFVLSACNFKDGLKETGDGIQTGAQNIGEALKETPEDVSEASNKVENDIKK